MRGIELKGLKNLISTNNLVEDSNVDDQNLRRSLSLLPIDCLYMGKCQPRASFDNDQLIVLSESIKKNGILQPILVRKINIDSYEIIAGERRWRAAKLAGLKEVPAIIRDISDNTALIFALIENLQREDLNPIDQALAMNRIIEEFSITHENVAELVGISRSSVSNLIRLLTLTEKAQEFLSTGLIEVGHAKVMLALNKNEQNFVTDMIVEKKLTVRDTENLVSRMKKEIQVAIVDKSINMEISKLHHILSQKLSNRFDIKHNNKGQITLQIKFGSLVEAVALAKSIKSEVNN